MIQRINNVIENTARAMVQHGHVSPQQLDDALRQKGIVISKERAKMEIEAAKFHTEEPSL